MKISFITTVFNEEAAIKKFLTSLFSQTKLPDEIIIVDGGSSDNTVERIKKQESGIKGQRITFKVLVKKGNRSVGRNEAIKQATGDIIVCSDSGNILDKDWVKNITKPFVNKTVDVVAGYYKGKAETVFQKAVIPYALVMEDKVDPQNFLPATRSIAFKKSIWKKVGKFDEKFSHNEDYVFARKLREVGANIVFAKDAFVNWIPRNSLKSAFIMMYRFAIGDAEAGILRPKVFLVFTRYFLAFYLILLAVLYRTYMSITVIVFVLIGYIIWSIKKNYRYVKKKEAITILPKLQFTADVAVLTGTSYGLIKRIRRFNYLKYVKQNKFLLFILLAYIGIELLTLKWGAPNQYHPFPYNMDEWHQLQAVRATAKFGTPNIEGSANGTLFHFLLSAIYLGFFTVIQFINPVVLKVNDLLMRERIFDLLRLNTIIYGSLSLVVLYYIHRIIKAPPKLALILFTFTPMWLCLSGLFKYDIALTLWILLSILFFIRYIQVPNAYNYLLAALPVALAYSVKISAIPLLLIYIVSYFWFSQNWKKNLKYFFTGMSVYLVVVFLFGMPDTLFGKGNIIHFFYENVITGPVTTGNFNLGMNPYLFLYTRHYPVIFGHGLTIFFVLASLFLFYIFLKEGIIKSISRYKLELFMFFSLGIFIISLLPLQIYAWANRVLVLLPYVVIICTLACKKMMTIPRFKIAAAILIFFVVSVQLYESIAWVQMKSVKSVHEVASVWIVKNIPEKQTIGLENIPIYQNIPDILQKEYYFHQYNVPYNFRYKYKIIDAKTISLPPVIVVTQELSDGKFYYNSVKRDLLERLEKEGYKRKIVFTPDFTFNKISEIDYFFSGLVPIPLNTSVYIR